MTSTDTDPGEQPAVRRDPAPLGRPGPQWEGRSRPIDQSPASEPAPGLGLEAPPREAPPVVLTAPGVVRVAGRERALAGMPVRIAAFMIDLFTIWVGLLILTSVTGGDIQPPDPNSAEFSEADAQVYLLGIAFQIAFYWVCNSLGWSPGKRLLGLRIVSDRGTAPGIGRGLARTVGPMLAGVIAGVLIAVLSVFLPPQPAFILGLTPVYLNYLWPLRDERRQAWHDKIASTFVVRAETEDDRDRAPAAGDGRNG